MSKRSPLEITLQDFETEPTEEVAKSINMPYGYPTVSVEGTETKKWVKVSGRRETDGVVNKVQYALNIAEATKAEYMEVEVRSMHVGTSYESIEKVLALVNPVKFDIAEFSLEFNIGDLSLQTQIGFLHRLMGMAFEYDVNFNEQSQLYLINESENPVICYDLKNKSITIRSVDEVKGDVIKKVLGNEAVKSYSLSLKLGIDYS